MESKALALELESKALALKLEFKALALENENNSQKGVRTVHLASPLTNLQMEILELYSTQLSEQELNELKTLIART